MNNSTEHQSELFYNNQKEDLQIQKLQNSIRQYFVFSDDKIKTFEAYVNEIVKKARNGMLKISTVDVTPLRNKYFFGERYTYGSQNSQSGIGREKLFPKNSVDPIPSWITVNIINPLIEAKILPKNFVNSVVINDYRPGGCIVSHIDPPHIFDRPIVSLSLFSDSCLCFGCKFKYKPLRCSTPLFELAMPRGVITSISGFAADEITHCIRPEDTIQRRAVIILRRVHKYAPRLPKDDQMDCSRRIFNNCDCIELKMEDFMKFYQYIRWQCDNGLTGKVTKRYFKKKNGNPRYTANLYKML
ncbi:RNA demethylase ALKBH5-like [Diabrotica undecimpunctata]|uniref:RNA demethylase ALKBH5-like n=1 Tax=Diabrotica undecimpunctata TaxID=50387 RepID=UPI003B636B6E